MAVITNLAGKVYLGANGGALVGDVSGIVPAYPIVTSLTSWNVEMRAGSVTPAVTLPQPFLTRSEEIRYIFTAATVNASFTAPTGFVLANDNGFAGLSAGNTLVYSNLTVGSIYETSFCVEDSTHITIIMKEWKTA